MFPHCNVHISLSLPCNTDLEETPKRLILFPCKMMPGDTMMVSFQRPRKIPTDINLVRVYH